MNDIDKVPNVPLVFDTLCLAIGDNHTYFKLGDDKNVERPYQNAEAAPQSDGSSTGERSELRADTDRETTHDPASDREIPGGTGTGDVHSELARWQHNALEDVKTQGWRVFETTVLTPTLVNEIKSRLYACRTSEEVRAVFAEADAKRPVDNKSEFKKRIHELFSTVAERGHKALGGDESED